MNQIILSIAVFFALIISMEVFASPIPAERLFTDQHNHSLTFSPNGKYISAKFKDESGDYFTIINAKTKLNQPVYKFSNNDYLLDYRWLSDDLIYMTTNIKGRDKEVLLYLDFDEEKIKVEPKYINLSGYVVSTLPRDPVHILYAKNVGRGEDFGYELYKIPADLVSASYFDKKYKVPDINTKGAFFVYDEQLQRLIMLTYDFENEKIELNYKALAEKEFTYLFSIGLEDYSFEPMGFISETKMAVISDKDSDKKILYEFDIPTQTFTDTLYEHQSYDVVSAEISSESQALESVSFYDHGQLTRLYFDDKSKKQSDMLLAAFPGEQFVIVSEHAPSRQKIIKTFASHQPGRYYHFKEDEKVAELLFSQFPNLENYTFDKSERFQVTAEDGKVVESILTRPRGNDLKTLIVMPHGGPVGVREYDFFNPTVQYLSSRGFSVLRVNFRGSSGYGKEFMEQGVGQFGKLIEQDISLAVNKIRSLYTFNNLCAIGSSYGGYSSFMLAIKQPDLYKCIVGAYGIYDLPLLFNYSNVAVIDEMREATESIVGEMNDSLFDVSPVYMAANIQAPSLLIAGKEDDIASAEHTRRMEYMLKMHGKDVRSVYYQGVGHGHHNWWGDWHENALTYQFLLETLNLPQIPIEQIQADDKELINKEYARIAWAYSNEKALDQDSEKAFEFYKLAAQYGNASAMNSVGWYLEYDEVIPNDLEQAFVWYNKSSEAGNEHASLTVAEFYYQGKWVKQDHEKAFELFKQAKKQGVHAGVNAKLARAYCLGHGTEKNINYCANMLQLEKLRKQKDTHNKVTKTSFTFLKNAIADIILQGEFTSEEYKTLHTTIADEYNLVTLSPKVTEKNFGVITQDQRAKSQYSGQQWLRADTGTKVGVQFNVSSGNMFSSNDDRAGLVGEWTLTFADNTTKQVYDAFLWGREQNPWNMRYTLKDEDLDAVSITLSLYDMFNRPIYNKQFAIKAQAENPAHALLK